MRVPLLLVSALALSACHHRSSDSPGNGSGDPCTSRAQCQSGLCYDHTCVTALPPAPSCPSPPGSPVLVEGSPAAAVDPGPSFCVSTAQDSVLPAEMVEYLGTLQVGTDATFAVTPGTSSFVIFSQRNGTQGADTIPITGFGSFPNAVVPTNLFSPDNTLYYDDSAGWPAINYGGLIYPNFTGLLGYDLAAGAISSGFQYPNTTAGVDRVLSSGGVTAGDWTFEVNDWAWNCPFGPAYCSGGDSSGHYGINTVTKAGPPTSTGTLDLEVYLVTDPSSAVSTAAAAAAHPQMDRWVRSVGAFLANAGLCLGQVTFHDVPQWAKDRYAPNGTVDVSSSGPCSDISQLFTTAVVPSRAVHVFLATDIVAPAQGAFNIVGLDGSIPGPSGFPGTINGGAVVSLADFALGSCSGTGPPSMSTCGTDVVAYIAAHEIGHWLGLYHTTERDGTIFDPASDTPPCPCHLCATTQSAKNKCADYNPSTTSPTPVINSYCRASATCGGGSNLMFWLLDVNDPNPGMLSPDQGVIVRFNPAVR